MDEQTTPENEIEEPEDTDGDFNFAENLDIDAALASVASLSDVIAEQEAEEAAEIARVEAQEEAQAEAERRRADYYFPRPPAMTLQRGQLASVIPALLLIALGAWLTFTLSTADTAPSTATIGLISAMALGVMLVGYWLSSERWLRGALFGGLSLIFLSGALLVITPEGWPLLLAAVGGAMLLSTVLSPGPSRGVTLFSGVLLVIAGVAGFAVTTEAIPTDPIATIAPVILVLALAVLFLPALLRR